MVLEPISFAELDAMSDQLEQLASLTPAIDQWCSRPDWVLSSNLAFAPESERLVLGDLETGLVLLTRYAPDEDGQVILSGLEPMWGFASPVLGPDPLAVLDKLANALAADTNWDSILLPGLPLDQSILQGMANSLAALGTVGFGVAIERQTADFSDGIDRWLERRSSRFRQRLRRRDRRAQAASVTIVDAADDPHLFERISDIETRSWKGKEGSGISSPEMATMYSTLIERLSRKDRVRSLIAQLDGQDVGYILGGEIDTVYRGLQISFDSDYGDLELGHLLQWHQIQRLSPQIATYDLGMVIEYKGNWADYKVPSPALILRRSSETR